MHLYAYHDALKQGPQTPVLQATIQPGFLTYQIGNPFHLGSLSPPWLDCGPGGLGSGTPAGKDLVTYMTVNDWKSNPFFIPP